MSVDYFDQSYPPSVLPYAKGATAGTPGGFTPAGSIVPASPAAMAAGYPVTITASPATAWTSGQYVQTQTAGAAGRASWSGTSWVSGAAPLADETPPESEPEPEPETFKAIPVEETPPDTTEA